MQQPEVLNFFRIKINFGEISAEVPSLKEKCSVQLLCESEVSDEVLSQALESYEATTSNVRCNNLSLDGMFVNANIGTVNVFVNTNNGIN